MRFGIALLPPVAKVRRIVSRFLEDIEILPWDSACAQAYASIAARQREIGKTLSLPDTMIAAHAVAHGMTLISNDHAFAQIEGLRWEDWTKEPLRG
jgi:tRNA(fMet)-specific endonuclease VapC